jgi:hypothetical protein
MVAEVRYHNSNGLGRAELPTIADALLMQISDFGRFNRARE